MLWQRSGEKRTMARDDISRVTDESGLHASQRRSTTGQKFRMAETVVIGGEEFYRIELLFLFQGMWRLRSENTLEARHDKFYFMFIRLLFGSSSGLPQESRKDSQRRSRTALCWSKNCMTARLVRIGCRSCSKPRIPSPRSSRDF